VRVTVVHKDKAVVSRRKRLQQINNNTGVKHRHVNVSKPYYGFCPVLPWQAHGGEFANFIVLPHVLPLKTTLIV
jgi:hypothetical protein